ncbi:MAG TPA: FAD-dependent oxidoreductase [Terriglobia bacterium]|nr:FAD-dependent oxidoreductase [Terriglobia bacterium]
MDRKLGVYICSGCSIGESIDVNRLVDVAQKEYKAPVCRTHPFLCGEEGLAAIRNDLAQGAIDSLVIAGCSPRTKTSAFSFDSPTVMDRVNLREHVAWSHEPGNEDTQMLAEDCLRMGIVKARKTEPLEPVSDGISKTILVVGGGVTGITAALEAADADYDVVLVEKKPQLGGSLAAVKKHFPTHPPYTELQETGLPEKIAKVTRHPKIKVYTSTRIVKTEGQPGMFDVTLQNGGQPFVHRAGAIVMATGWKPYDASKLSHLGYGSSPDIVTNDQFEAMIGKGALVRPSDGKPARSVLFIQCAGSRDKEHLPYCSSVCCMATLKQADVTHQANPATKVYIVYRDIITTGQYERYFAKVQNHPATFLMKGDVVAVRAQSGERLQVDVKNTLLDEDITVPADIVVLATGLVPNAADNDAIRDLRDAHAKVRRNESETQRAEAEKTVERLRSHEGTEILNLAYRQGPDLPILRDGFPNSNFVCFPYETLRTGIYAAGAVRAPMDSAGAEEDAMGAAMKAIQSVEMASSGQAVHPRAGDLSYPSFLLQRCTQCKRCTVECPFGSIDEDAKGTPKLNPYRCRRCGVCMGACPERIISFKNYSVDMIASMIKAIKVPEDEEEKLRVLLFMCENDAYPALDVAGMNHAVYDASVRVIPLRCLGSMNIVWIADALSRGIDGVMLMGCKYGEDYQCHFAKGSEIAHRRLENVKETLQRLQLESERVEVSQVSIDQYEKMPEMINTFMERIRELGPNPYKGF